MALYRQDIQYGIPLYEAPLGFYWCTQVYYWEAADDAAYATARDGTSLICGQGLNTNTYLWVSTVRTWPANTLIEHFVPAHVPSPLSGPFDPPTLTVFVAFRGEGRMVSYKRVRSPVRHEDYNADLTLTPWALNHYQTNFDQVAAAGYYRNFAGVPIDEAQVHPKVVSWQLRRGTRRRWEQRLLY